MGNSYASQRKLERRQSVRQLLRNDEEFSGSKYLEYCGSGNLGGIQRQLKFPNSRPAFIDRDGNSAAHHCARTGEVKALKLLFSRYITHARSSGRNKPMLKKVLNSENHKGETPLQLAVKDGYVDVVKLLIANGANVKATCHIADEMRAVSSKENTYLHLAVSESNEDMVHLLVAGGLRIDQGNDAGETPLFDAALRFDQRMIDLLLLYGADVHIPNKSGVTPAHILLFEVEDPRAERLTDAEKRNRTVVPQGDAQGEHVSFYLLGNGVYGFFDKTTGACVCIEPGLAHGPHVDEHDSVADSELVTAVAVPASASAASKRRTSKQLTDTEDIVLEEKDGADAEPNAEKATSNGVVKSNQDVDTDATSHPAVYHELDSVTELSDADRARFALAARELTRCFDRDNNPPRVSEISLAGRAVVAKHRRRELHDTVREEQAGVDYQVAEDVVSFVYGAPERELS